MTDREPLDDSLVELCRRHQDLARQAAQVLTVGFEGHLLGDSLKRLLDANVAGVVLFARNIDTAAQVAELVRSIKEYAGRPIYVGIDQEGGLVQRLRRGFTRFPAMRSVGLQKDVALAHQVGRILGQELRAVGVDVNFAPVLDVDTNPNNPVIGSRSLSSDPALVARLGVAMGQGMQSSGVASCGKHFPGHGDTAQDSHIDLPRLNHSLERLWSVELVPFRAWADAKLAALMTAHVVFECVEAHLPATMSRFVLDDILRKKLQYDGLVFSDDLEMKAICEHFGYQQAALFGLAAGVDNFLCCHSEHVARNLLGYVTRGVLEGTVDKQRLDEARRRSNTLAETWARPAEPPRLEDLETPEARWLIDAMERQAPGGSHFGEDPTGSIEKLRE